MKAMGGLKKSVPRDSALFERLWRGIGALDHLAQREKDGH
jgi:hypothetical protein